MTPPTPGLSPMSPVDAQWATLADLALRIAREIQFRGYTSAQAIPLSMSEGMVMRVLHARREASPTQLTEATGLQRTHLSAVLRGLEGKGLVERRPDADDGRGVRVRPTARGTSNYQAVRAEWAAAVSADTNRDDPRLDGTISLLREVEMRLVRDRPANAGGIGAAAPR